MAARPDRFEFADDLFLRRHRGAGSPIVNQLTWRLPDAYDPARVRAFGEAVARGALHRRATRTHVPFARDRWAPAGVAPSIRLEAQTLDDRDLIEWMAAEAHAGIDPSDGRSWRLTAAPTTTGSVVALTVAHAAADGAALLDAVVRGATDDPVAPIPLPASGELLRDDLRDAGAQARAVGRWFADRRGAGPQPYRTPLTPVTDEPPLPPAWRTPLAVAELDTAELEAIAAARGGSLNSWFVAATARISAATGRVVAGDHVPVALPVATRGAVGDRRANSTDIARADLDPDALAARDLGRVRALCKQAYVELAAAPPPPVPLAAVQMLPDAVIKRLPQPPAATLLASNLGSFPDAARLAFGPEAGGIAALAHQVGATAAEVDAAGPGLCAWATVSGARTTVSIAAFDPRRVPSRGALAERLGAELDAWGVKAELW